MSATTAEAAIKVATYNVHAFVGRDGLRNPLRIAAVLAEIDADIVALQEVELGPGDADSLRSASGGSLYELVEGVLLHDRQHPTGNVVLSRVPVRGVTRLDLEAGRREARGAIVVDLDLPAQPLRFVATHLGLRRGERRGQVRQILDHLDRRPGPVVLAGDMNEWRPASAVLRAIRKRFGRSSARRSFPARRPLFALDRIFVAPPARLEELHLHGSPLARQASDHLPVWGRVAVQGRVAPLGPRERSGEGSGRDSVE